MTMKLICHMPYSGIFYFLLEISNKHIQFDAWNLI